MQHTSRVPDGTTGRDIQGHDGRTQNSTQPTANTLNTKKDGPQKQNDREKAVKKAHPTKPQLHHQGNGAENQSTKLTDAEKAAQAKYIETYRRGGQQGTQSFQMRADACFRIQEEKLYREYPTQAAFFKAKLDLGRSTGLRLADMGRILNRLSPSGDNRLLTTDSHCRPLLKLSEADQSAAIEYAKGLASMAGSIASASIIEAAVALLYPAEAPKDETHWPSRKLAEKFKQLVEKTEADLPKDVSEQVVKLFRKMAKQALALGGPSRTTGIDWADSTWNPLAGCSHCSRGCDNCFAARDAATRLADVYPGLAKKTKIDDNETYAFTGKIVLLPERLADPLKDRVPKRYFVNSMSDLFHPKVPDAFIEAVFDVMEKAHWHVFQVLTKRPERMVAFTQKRYKVEQPRKNIWLGTSVEDQESYDKRIVHLRNTKAALIWLSVEPMLASINFGDLTGIGWMVVGGESGSDRKMEKGWVLDARNECNKFNVPFFFKQWGDFNEQGEKRVGKPKKDGLVPATLDGTVYNAFPEMPTPREVSKPK